MEGWTIGYVWHTLIGDLNLDTPQAYGDFFANFVGMGADGHFFSGQTSVPIFFLLAMLANFWLIYRGVSKGIEWFCKWSMPVLFIVATQSVAVILYTLFPVLSLVISVVSMVGSLGATLSGLTFPLSAMSPVVQYTAKLFPVRHFTEAMQCMVYFDGGFSACWPQLAVLCLFPLVAVALLPRLQRIFSTRPYDTLPKDQPLTL